MKKKIFLLTIQVHINFSKIKLCWAPGNIEFIQFVQCQASHKPPCFEFSVFKCQYIFKHNRRLRIPCIYVLASAEHTLKLERFYALQIIQVSVISPCITSLVLSFDFADFLYKTLWNFQEMTLYLAYLKMQKSNQNTNVESSKYSMA